MEGSESVQELVSPQLIRVRSSTERSQQQTHTAMASLEGKRLSPPALLKAKLGTQCSSEFVTLFKIVMLQFIWLAVSLVTPKSQESQSFVSVGL